MLIFIQWQKSDKRTKPAFLKQNTILFVNLLLDRYCCYILYSHFCGSPDQQISQLYVAQLAMILPFHCTMSIYYYFSRSGQSSKTLVEYESQLSTCLSKDDFFDKYGTLLSFKSVVKSYNKISMCPVFVYSTLCLICMYSCRATYDRFC